MRALRRTLTGIVFLGPLAVLAVLAVLLVQRYRQETERHLAPLLAAEITRALGHETTVGDVRIRGGFAHVDDVRVALGATFAESGGRSLLSARQLVLDFDLGRLLLETDPAVPLFNHVRVIEPRAYAARDRRGRWSFEDLLRTAERAPERRTAGRVTVLNGTLNYVDEALPHHPSRRQAAFDAELGSLNGEVRFEADRSIVWSATAEETRGRARQISVAGSWLPDTETLLLRIRAERLHLPLVSRFVARNLDIRAGKGSGDLTILRVAGRAGRARWDYQADVRVAGGELKLDRFREPFVGINGEVTAAPAAVTGRADGWFAGSRIHAEGTGLDTREPVLNGWVSGQDVRLQRLLRALALEREYPALRGVAASADVRVDLQGPPDSLAASGRGAGAVQGRLPGGTDLAPGGSLQFAFSGSLKEPRLTVTGTLPRVRHGGWEARGVWLAAAYGPGLAAVDFQGSVGGGTVHGRATILPAGRRSRCSVTLRVRNVEAARLPIESEQPVRGTVSADVVADGRFDQPNPRVRADVRAVGIQYGEWRAERARASLEGDGLAVRVRHLTVRGRDGLAVVQGSVDLRRRTVDLAVSADRINLARLPVSLPQEGGGREALRGYLFVREGRIQGPWQTPSVSAFLRGYGVGLGSRLRADYLSARMTGDRQRLEISSAHIWRFPASASAEGFIDNPLSERARVSLSGEFERVDLQDVGVLGGTDVALSGTARGEWVAEGLLSGPVVTASSVVVEHPTFGQYAFERATGTVVLDASGDETVVSVPEFALVVAGERVTGSVRLAGDRFHVAADSTGVDLGRLERFVAPYASIRGKAEASADIRGRLEEGRAADLSGTLSASTSGLAINGQSFGELRARVRLEGRSAVSEELALGGGSEGIHVASLRWDLEHGTVAAQGTVRGLSLEKAGRALAESPYVAAYPKSFAAEWLQPLARPFRGALDGKFALRGPIGNPDTEVQWRGREMAIGDQAVQEFTGAVAFNRRVAQLLEANLRADPIVGAASGTLVAGQQVTGDLDVNNLPLELLPAWMPDRAELAGLQGTADKITLHASGRPDRPELSATVEASDVRWEDSAGALLPGRPWIERIRTAPVTVARGRIEAADVSLLLRELPEAYRAASKNPAGIVPSPGSDPGAAAQESVERRMPPVRPPEPPAEPRRYEAHIRGGVDFAWDPPGIPEDAQANLRVTVDRQGLGILTVLNPRSGATLEGTLTASLGYAGAFWQLFPPDPATGRREFVPPALTGHVEVSSPRIAFAKRTTEIRDLDARITFASDLLRVERFTARTQAVSPRYASRKSDPFTISGELPIQRAREAPGLVIAAPRVIVAESPLPVFQSGGIVGEVSTDDPATPQVETLRVTGSLFRPVVAGTLTVRSTDFRVPDALAAREVAAVPLPATPTFDLRFQTAGTVRVGTAQLTALVRTPPGEPASLTGTLGEDLRLIGTLAIERGTLAFPTARFAIQRGSQVSLRYPYTPPAGTGEPTLGVLVDVTAVARLTAASVSGARRRYTITVEAEGPLNSDAPVRIDESGGIAPNPRGLRLTFRSDPPDLALSQAGLQRRVAGLLGGQSAIEELFSRSPNVGRLLADQSIDIITASILPDLFERTGIGSALGFEEFSLEYNRVDAFTIRLSRPLLGPLHASYWRRLSGAGTSGLADNAAWEFKLSWRLKNNVQFSWKADDQRTNAYLLEGVFRF